MPTNTTPRPTSDSSTTERLWLLYDIFMLIAITIDLFIIGLDMVIMSEFVGQIAHWLALEDALLFYKQVLHHPLRIIDGFFTLFLIAELLLRWLLSILKKQHLRWFFFPVIHWYEVLGCFPQLRALRLLRAVVIVRKLYQLGYRILPQKWLETGKFYYDVVFEEISDRVILTATDNLRQQLGTSTSASQLITTIVEKNQVAIDELTASLIKQQITPRIKTLVHSDLTAVLSKQVGASVQYALANTPELKRYLRLIPIAGGLIESQLHHISEQIGANLVTALLHRLGTEQTTDALIDAVITSIGPIPIKSDALDTLIASVINDSLTEFEQQVKVQQWKHKDTFAPLLD